MGSIWGATPETLTTSGTGGTATMVLDTAAGGSSVNAGYVTNLSAGTVTIAITGNTATKGCLIAEIYAPAPPSPLAVWTGAVNTNWDSATTNWNVIPVGGTSGSAGAYSNADKVVFDDTASQFTVNLLATNTPVSVTFSNFLNSYTIGSAGGFPMAGYTTLTLAGTNTVTLLNTNTFTGSVAIAAGQLVIGGAGQLGGGTYAGSIADNGSFIQNSSSAQTLSGVISGPGTLINNGPGIVTLTGLETFTGPTIVNGGILALNHGNAGTSTLSTSSSLTINNGGTVMVDSDNSLQGSTVALGSLPITINSGGTLTSLGTADANAGASTHIRGVLTLAGGTLATGGSGA